MQLLKAYGQKVHVDIVVILNGKAPSISTCFECVEQTHIDLLQDRLPTPFGLVRSGVAPDHPDTKVVMIQCGSCPIIQRTVY